MNLSNGIVDNYFSVLKDDFVKNGETNWSENQENMRNNLSLQYCAGIKPTGVPLCPSKSPS